MKRTHCATQMLLVWLATRYRTYRLLKTKRGLCLRRFRHQPLPKLTFKYYCNKLALIMAMQMLNTHGWVINASVNSNKLQMGRNYWQVILAWAISKWKSQRMCLGSNHLGKTMMIRRIRLILMRWVSELKRAATTANNNKKSVIFWMIHVNTNRHRS